MSHPGEQVLRSLYDAFARRDMDAIAGLLADDVVFHQPGRNVISGDYRGVEAVVGMMRLLSERSEGTFRATPHDVIGGDEHAVSMMEVSAQREGRSLEGRVVHVAHIRDGKVAELWVQPADQYAVDEFWA